MVSQTMKRLLRYLLRRHSGVLALGMSLGIFVGLLALIEGTCTFLLNRAAKQAPPPLEVAFHGLGSHDPVLGYRAQPNRESVQTLRRGETVIYETLYRTDAHRRRITPQTNTATRERFALFFGCSFTFGEGVADDETLPAQFAALAPEHHAYNYGYGGHGPQHLYLQLTEMDVLSGVEESAGIVVYSLFRDQIMRAVGNMRLLSTWGPILPCVTLDRGQLHYRGSFEEAWPFRIRLYRLASLSRTLEYFQLDWPPRLRRQDYDLAAHLFHASARYLETQFDDVQLYVLNYPGADAIEELEAALARLQAQGKRSSLRRPIVLLNYSELLDEVPEAVVVEYPDGHPTAYTHRRVTEALAEDIY